MVDDGVFVVQVRAHIVGVDLNPGVLEVFELAAGGVDLFNGPDRVHEEAFSEVGDGVSEVVAGEGEQGEFEFRVGGFDLLADGVGGAIGRGEVQLHRAATDEEVGGRIPRLVRTEFGVGGIRRRAIRAPHFMELDGVGAGEALVLENDDVVQVLHEVPRGEVGRAGQHKGGLGVFRVADDELVVHAAALAIGAGVGWDATVEGAEARVGVLPFVDPADLDSVGGRVVEGGNQRLVVQVVGGHIEGVLGRQNPGGDRVVEVRAEGHRDLVGGGGGVDGAVEVDVDVSRRTGDRGVGSDGRGGALPVGQGGNGAGVVDLAGFEARQVHAVVRGAGGACGRGAQGFRQAVLDDAIRSEVRGPAERKARGGHVRLDDGGGVANAGGRNEITGATGQQLVAAEAVERELGHDAEQIDGTSGEGLAHEAVAVAHVDDARLSVCREVVGVVPRDFLAGEGKGDAVDPDQLALQCLIQVGRPDDERSGNGARAFEDHGGQVRSDLEQAIVLGDLTGHGEGVADGGLCVPIGPVGPRVQGNAGGGVLQVADRTEVGVAGDHTGDGHDVADAVVGARVEDVVLRGQGTGAKEGRSREKETGHGRFWSPLSSSTALTRIMRGGPTKTSAMPLPPSGP